MTSELEANPAVLLEVSAQRTVKRGVNSQQLRPLLATAFPGSCSTSARISNVRVARPCRICRPWRVRGRTATSPSDVMLLSRNPKNLSPFVGPSCRQERRTASITIRGKQDGRKCQRDAALWKKGHREERWGMRRKRKGDKNVLLGVCE